jgi:hypothetical protein
VAEEGEEELAAPAKKGSGLQSCKLLKLGRKGIDADRPKETTDCIGGGSMRCGIYIRVSTGKQETIQRPEKQNIKFPLAGILEHSLELFAI